MIAQVLVDGVVIGALYAVMATSYGLVFGVIRIVNFAQGELFTLGAFGGLAGWTMTSGWPIGARVAAAIVVAGVAASAAGLLMERLVFRPLLRRDSPALLGLIASLGLSLFIQNMLRLGVASSNMRFPGPADSIRWHLGEAMIGPVQPLIVAISAVLVLVTVLFVERTPQGLAIVAVRDNKELARAHGISVGAVLRGVFAAGSLTAAVAGLLLGLYYGVVRYDMGFLPGIKAFTACIMGGLGNIRGAALAGLVLGLVESLGAAYISSAYRDGFAFILLIAVLLMRPQGLLGEASSA